LPSQAELDKQASRLDITKTKKSVIYVGGMVPIRGIRELVEAFDSLEEAELWLLGPFGSKDFENSLRRLSGWRNVRYFGVVEPHEIFGYVQKADAGIVTFWPEPNHVKTLATKPFEYMACGLPMIMSDFPYWRDFFGDSSLYVNPKDPDGIARTVRGLLEDDELLATMGERNRQKSKTEYNWRSERQELFRLYSSFAGVEER
jgi:glycosyltransferase involved in cell wall biosynthesis